MAKVRFGRTRRGNVVPIVDVVRDDRIIGELHGPHLGQAGWRPDGDLKKLTGDFQERLLADAKNRVRASLSGD